MHLANTLLVQISLKIISNFGFQVYSKSPDFSELENAFPFFQFEWEPLGSDDILVDGMN